jgi:phosphatidylglycerol:prolipoprotein diacylglycerol transferase
MYPLLFNTVPLYFVMWACAIVTAVAVGGHLGARAGFPRGRSAVAIALLAVSVLVGSKLLYLAEAHWFPLDDYVPPQVRTSFHGFRIPGGILLLAATMPLVCRALQLPWRRFGDVVMPLVAVGLVFIRLGCFLNGCCFGRSTAVPWAIAFPRGSWAFWYHATHGWVSPDAVASLRVHPLQLYFVVAAGATLAVLLWLRQQRVQSGFQQVIFYALFFGTTAVLEPLRQNHLSLNSWIVPLVAVVAACSLYAHARRTVPSGGIRSRRAVGSVPRLL